MEYNVHLEQVISRPLSVVRAVRDYRNSPRSFRTPVESCGVSSARNKSQGPVDMSRSTWTTRSILKWASS